MESFPLHIYNIGTRTDSSFIPLFFKHIFKKGFLKHSLNKDVYNLTLLSTVGIECSWGIIILHCRVNGLSLIHIYSFKLFQTMVFVKNKIILLPGNKIIIFSF